MPKEKLPFEGLIPYLPEGSYDHVMPYIFNGQGHRISVNANLNKYSFLVTLLHELAHLFT